MNVRIKENSWLAKIAAKRLREKQAAFVLGSTIYLWNVSKENFLANQKWLRHELAHIYQFKQYGFFTFIFLYLKETSRKGYRQNKFEVEAREKEIERNLIERFVFK